MSRPDRTPSLSAAIEQLHWAIRLTIDHRAFVPAITLAGAARGVLEALLAPSAQTAFDELRNALVLAGYGERDEIGKLINGPRNFLKHADERYFRSAEADTESSAIYEIILGLNNLAKLGGPVSAETIRFLEWLRDYRPDLS